ncbi:MAG: cohesin domain-containing protein [Patescibacteria group bacterium]|nr:cohesin domain-containing protein [Patescibacteria group bacterium]
MTRKITISLLTFFAFVFLINLPQTASAAGASLYLSPSSGVKSVGSTFSIGIKVNSGGNVINAAEGTLSYDGAILETVNTSKGGSIFPFWTQEPSASGGVIRFGGGLPPPAYNGSAGHIISVTFKAKKAGEAKINFSSGAVLANDGKGTNIISGMGGASFTIRAAGTQPAVPTKPKEPAEPKEKDYNKPIIKSSTHPDQVLWYKEKEVKFSWDMPDGVSGVSVLLDQKEYTDPGPKSDGDFNEKSYTVEEDGIWYLHLKLKDASRWGTLAHYRVNIDSFPPDKLEVEIVKASLGEWPTLKFAASDALSGLSNFLIHIGSLEEQSYDLSAEEKELKLSNFDVGEYIAMIRAFDKAGNERVKTIKFTIDPIEAPLILNYQKELKSSDNLYVSGTAKDAASTTIHIELDGKIIMSAKTGVDLNGNWFYVFDDEIKNGRYTLWAESINKNGIGSLPSEKKTFLVTPPVFMVIGNFVINYFTVFVSLLFLIILIVLFIFWIVGLVRKKLKKETIEIEEVLRHNSAGMKKAINEEADEIISSRLKTDKLKAIKRLISKVDENEQKTLKEVKDVEEILK